VHVQAVADDADTLMRAAGAFDGSLRIVVTRGGRRLLFTEALPDLPDAVRLTCVTYSPTRLLDGVKSLSYAANMLATRLAQERGFDDALLVTPHGRILEAPTSSFFWVRDGELLTPPLAEHILASITRQLVFDLVGAREQVCTIEDVAAADEAFLVSSIKEAMPVIAVDDQTLAVGPRTAEVARVVRDHIAGVIARAR
jgi:branched-chain amino acid aminotransferase